MANAQEAEQFPQKQLTDSLHVVKWRLFRDMMPLLSGWNDSSIIIVGPDVDQ